MVVTDNNRQNAEVALGRPMSLFNVQTTSDPICSSAGCEQYLHPQLPPELQHPIDYPVPNFGVDHGILDVHASIAAAEKQLNHKWEPELKAPEAPPTPYVDRGIDQDIKDSLSHMETQEGIHGAWNPKQDADGNWIVPQAINNKDYSYTGDAVFAQTESDPICSSAGCDQYLHPVAPDAHPVDYFVPNFGVDHEIKDNFNSLGEAEKIRNHEWIWKWLPTPINPAKATLYNFSKDQALEDDMVHTAKHLETAEANLGVRFEPWRAEAMSQELQQ